MAPHLTFDDGPAEDTAALLDVLARHRVTATFFLVGERVAQHRALVERLLGEGHALGNHSWDHPDLRLLPLDAVRSQLNRTSDAIEAVTGVRPSIFRPPYGHTSEPIEALARSLGMRTVLWDVVTYDWTCPGTRVIAASIASASAEEIVLLHDGPAGRRQTVAAVELALSAAPDLTQVV
jgi:peptidoglycan/xylan/chitin deacetylase (PgdA/CDA1 family)